MISLPDKHILSKSTFMRGSQCTKSLYLHKNQPELKDEISEQQEATFDRGTSVGELARKIFPGGIDASPESSYEYQKSVAVTQELINSGECIIYEAAFQFEGVLAAIDILVKEGNEWRAYEVKSTTRVKETHIQDAALQYYVITNAGILLSDISIVHLNNQYIRIGELDLRQLFIVESILEEVNDNQDFVADKILELKAVINMREEPIVEIGEHCHAPYSCDFEGHCWRHIPQPSVFDISRLRAKKQFDLYNQGIIRFEDITEDVPLNFNQRLQVSSHLNKTEYLDRSGIGEFLSGLSYPLYFLDFETFNPAIPLYDHNRPYQQIPFQYSIHHKENRDGELRHDEFLALPTSDPRLAFIERLITHTEGLGDILTYNQNFEKTRLKELARDFPEYAAALIDRISRINNDSTMHIP